MTPAAPAQLTNVTLSAGKPPILVAEADGEPARWAAEHHDALRAFVAEHGSLLVRGLGLRDAQQAAAVFRQLGSLMTEREAFASRQRLFDGVYTSSKWPANQTMCQHHELSYTLRPPSLMLFACLTPAASGGATPLADASSVLDAMPAELVESIERSGWLLVRNYNGDIGASVADAFGTDDRQAVQRYCRANEISFEWLPDGALRTRQRRPAVVRHPASGRRCWFNQVAFLSEWTMAPELRDYLVDLYGAEGLPFTTRLGNGDAIGADVVQAINEAYEANTVREPWRAGDLMLVDNIRTAHGRELYEGPREVVVGMADPVSRTDGA